MDRRGFLGALVAAPVVSKAADSTDKPPSFSYSVDGPGKARDTKITFGFVNVGPTPMYTCRRAGIVTGAYMRSQREAGYFHRGSQFGPVVAFRSAGTALSIGDRLAVGDQVYAESTESNVELVLGIRG